MSAKLHGLETLHLYKKFAWMEEFGFDAGIGFAYEETLTNMAEECLAEGYTPDEISISVQQYQGVVSLLGR